MQWAIPFFSFENRLSQCELLLLRSAVCFNQFSFLENVLSEGVFSFDASRVKCSEEEKGCLMEHGFVLQFLMNH